VKLHEGQSRLVTHRINKGALMSENGNTNIVQNVYENFRAGEIKALLNLLSDDIEWQLPEIENVPFALEARHHKIYTPATQSSVGSDPGKVDPSNRSVGPV
jgi:hypothetical protein